jgi:hypothetical protein
MGRKRFAGTKRHFLRPGFAHPVGLGSRRPDYSTRQRALLPAPGSPAIAGLRRG